MPFSAENDRLYPGGSVRSPEWDRIRSGILRRALSCCELCGAMNHAVRRKVKGKVPYKTVLTIAHLDHNPANNDTGNLKALCQPCRNRHDVQHRAATRHLNHHKDQLNLYGGQA